MGQGPGGGRGLVGELDSILRITLLCHYCAGNY